MDNFLQQLINGLTLGSIYGLIAIGYTMVFGIIGMVNFAHGDVFMLSAFIALIIFLALTQFLGVTSLAAAFVVVLVVAMVLTGLWNWTIERLRLPAVARIFPPGAADLGDRHVDLPVEFRPGDAGSAQKAGAADVRQAHRSDQWRQFQRHDLLQADHDHAGDGAAARRLLVCRAEDRRSGGRSALAPRTAAWPHSSASMSTAPFR